MLVFTSLYVPKYKTTLMHNTVYRHCRMSITVVFLTLAAVTFLSPLSSQPSTVMDIQDFLKSHITSGEMHCNVMMIQ
jgi:hypothetical protein